MDHEAAGGRGALWAWLALVAAVTLLNIGTVMFVDVPADRIYRYSTTVLALLQFGLMLAVVGVIARAGGLREVLALRAPSSWLHAAAVGAVVFIGTVLLLVVLAPLLRTGDVQGLSPAWDPRRALPFAVNAMVIAVVAPIVEELTYRGLGFTLLARFGRGAAITLTAMVFAASHGHVAVLPTSFAFGLGLGYLRSRTASVYPGIAVHVLINAMGVSAIALGS